MGDPDLLSVELDSYLPNVDEYILLWGLRAIFMGSLVTLVRRFHDKRKMHMVNWKSIIALVIQSGLGILNLKDMNKALIVK